MSGHATLTHLPKLRKALVHRHRQGGALLSARPLEQNVMKQQQALVFDPLRRWLICIGDHSLGIVCLPTIDHLEAFQSGFHKERTNQPKPSLDSPHRLCLAFRSTENGEENIQNSFDNLLDTSGYPKYENAKIRQLTRREQPQLLDFPYIESGTFHIQLLHVL